MAKVLCAASSCAVALFTSFLTLMMGLSRFANAFGAPADLYVAIVVGAVGLVGGVVVLLRAGLGVVVLLFAAVLTVVLIPPDNVLPTVLYVAGGLLAFFAYGLGRAAAGGEDRV